MVHAYEYKYNKSKKSGAKNNLKNNLSYSARIFNQFIICCLIILSILVLNLINLGQQKNIKALRSKLKNILAQNNLVLDFNLDFNLKSDLKKIKALDFNMLNKNIYLGLDKILNLDYEKHKSQDQIEIDKKIINKIIKENEELNSIKKKLF